MIDVAAVLVDVVRVLVDVVRVLVDVVRVLVDVVRVLIDVVAVLVDVVPVLIDVVVFSCRHDLFRSPWSFSHVIEVFEVGERLRDDSPRHTPNRCRPDPTQPQPSLYRRPQAGAG